MLFYFLQGIIEASYANFGEAWETISSSFPPLTLVCLDGVFLKKVPNGNNWVPVIIGYSTNIPEFNSETLLESEISLWHILDFFMLISFDLPDNVVKLLAFMCQCIWMESCSNYSNKIQIDTLLAKFRDFDVPEQNEVLNSQKIKQREKLKNISTELQNVVLTIFKSISTDRVVSSTDIIEVSFGEKFKYIDRNEMKKLILKSMAHGYLISSILQGDYGLGVFFGERAVRECNALVRSAIPDLISPDVDDAGGADDNYQWSDRIFEDEGENQYELGNSQPEGTK